MFSDIYINGIIDAVKAFNSSEQSEFDFLNDKIALLLSVNDITTDQADELSTELKLRYHTAKECYCQHE